jgi:hypothetical protein
MQTCELTLLACCTLAAALDRNFVDCNNACARDSDADNNGRHRDILFICKVVELRKNLHVLRALPGAQHRH